MKSSMISKAKVIEHSAKSKVKGESRKQNAERQDLRLKKNGTVSL
jgi:hypothetical protein